jgi:RNA polymerase sigma-70 factor (sigma-E family)
MDLRPYFGNLLACIRIRCGKRAPILCRHELGGGEQPSGGTGVFHYVDYLDTEGTDGTDAEAWTADRHVAALYQAHALGLARLALVMLGDPAAAEDVVQDAFLGLYRRWDSLADASVALSYLRTSVLNGCRTALRRRAHRGVLVGVLDGESAGFAEPALESAEATVVLGEEHRAVLAAIRRLPDRQREALVLRYYLDMTEDQAAEAMRVSRGTVKSATSRAIAAIGRMLREGS